MIRIRFGFEYENETKRTNYRTCYLLLLALLANPLLARAKKCYCTPAPLTFRR